MSGVALKGSVINAPKSNVWMINKSRKNEDDHKYTYEPGTKWNPLNSNLMMNSIKVVVKQPIPEDVVPGDAFEDTMLLLEMLKEKKASENKKNKDEMIRAMAMQQKMKNMRK